MDDVGDGDVIIYTDAGGNDPSTKRQIADQSLDHPRRAHSRSRCCTRAALHVSVECASGDAACCGYGCGVGATTPA